MDTKTFPLAVTYTLSSAGQRAALAAGLPAQQTQTVTVDAPTDLLAALPGGDGRLGIVIDAKGAASLSLARITDGRPYESGGAFAFDAPPADGLAAVSTWRAAMDTERFALLQRQTAIRAKYLNGEALTEPEDRDLPRNDDAVKAERLRRAVVAWMGLPDLGRKYGSAPTPPPQEAAERPDVAAEYQRRLAEHERQQAEKREREAREATTRMVRQAEQREWTQAFLAEHGEPTQRERFDAGLLPADELAETLERHFLGALVDRFGRYQPIEPHEVCDDCASLGGGFDYETRAQDSLTGPQWQTLQAIRAALPQGATAESRYHRGTCRDGHHDAEGHGFATRDDVLVKLTVGSGHELRVMLALPE